MTNLEKYNQIFVDVFSIEKDQLNADFDKQHVEGWDSVRQLSLTTAIEDTFDIMLDADDIIELSSYEKGREILRKYDIEL